MPPATSTVVPLSSTDIALLPGTTAQTQSKGGGRKRRKTTTPVKTGRKQVIAVSEPTPLLGLENRQLKLDATPPVLLNDMEVQLEFNPPLRPPEPQHGSANSSISAEVTTVNTSSLVGDKYGVLITYPPIIPIDGEGSGETSLMGAAKRGIFDRGAESGTEMNWSSDESTSINPASKDISKNTPTAQTATETSSHSLTPTGSFRKKGAWSEEESRCLLEGVEKFGEGKWKEIRAESYSVLKHRTTNQLKDKYRNIKGRSKHY